MEMFKIFIAFWRFVVSRMYHIKRIYNSKINIYEKLETYRDYTMTALILKYENENYVPFRILFLLALSYQIVYSASEKQRPTELYVIQIFSLENHTYALYSKPLYTHRAVYV